MKRPRLDWDESLHIQYGCALRPIILARSPRAPCVLLADAIPPTSMSSQLSSHPLPGRASLLPDYRGRGNSIRVEWGHYSPPSTARVLVYGDRLLDRAALIGTSRGGHHSLIMAAMRPMRSARWC